MSLLIGDSAATDARLRTAFNQFKEPFKRSSLISGMLFEWQTYRERQRALHTFAQAPWSSIEVLRPHGFRKFAAVHGDTCHVVGSGWSALDSLARIGSADYVIGFNFSALAAIEFDMYFLEVATRCNEERSETSDLLARIVIPRLGSQIKRYALKHLWLGLVDPHFVQATYGDSAHYLADYNIPAILLDASPHTPALTAERLLREDEQLLGSHGTSAITAIGYAWRLGFKRIVVHGLDGAGPHFFMTQGFQIPDSLTGIRKLYPISDVREVFEPGRRGLRVLGALRDAVQRRGGQLLTGSEISPSAEYLDVY